MAAPFRVLVVFGTRPEAIKMAPVVKSLRDASGIEPVVCVTGQHREMLDQALQLFGIEPDFDLDIMRPNQDLSHITNGVLTGISEVLRQCEPHRVLVHGDTTTTFAASLASFYLKVPVGHVEAGLRSGNIHAPWPEEMNRRLADSIADKLFAPTEGARQNLLKEGADDGQILVTGNTVIDALFDTVDMLRSQPDLHKSASGMFPFLDENRRMILVTGHRRESFDGGFERISQALFDIAQRDDVQVVYPVHLNPNVRGPVNRILGGMNNVHLIEPVDYLPFVYLLDRCNIVVTDSGGIQEEAPSLGKPVLVMRDVTERPEGVAAGNAKLVGTKTKAIVDWVERLLNDGEEYGHMSKANNPYGDGKASQRIVEEIACEAGI